MMDPKEIIEDLIKKDRWRYSPRDKWLQDKIRLKEKDLFNFLESFNDEDITPVGYIICPSCDERLKLYEGKKERDSYVLIFGCEEIINYECDLCFNEWDINVDDISVEYRLKKEYKDRLDNEKIEYTGFPCIWFHDKEIDKNNIKNYRI